jgi:hypothetical protein
MGSFWSAGFRAGARRLGFVRHRRPGLSLSLKLRVLAQLLTPQLCANFVSS